MTAVPKGLHLFAIALGLKALVMGAWAAFGSARIPSAVLLGLAAAWLLGSLCLFFLAYHAALHLRGVQPVSDDLPVC